MRKNQSHILIVDDQEEILFSAKMVLKKNYEHLYSANNPNQIVALLGAHPIDVVLLDMNYRIGFEDGREGIHWLKEIKLLSPKTIVVLMTAFGKVETAVEGLKSGAFDYIMKPWDNNKLLETVATAVSESRKLQKKIAHIDAPRPYFIGTAPKIKQAYSLAEKVAKTDANVLILGENGTGKFVLAAHIHQHSNRKDTPFVHVDLGSLNENLFESELFGYAKGAFTDAKTDSMGRFESAMGGTIFLDEIGNIPLHLQAKLLHVIQTKTVTRLGESKARAIDVRIITATNSDLNAEVKAKNFREDLFYRINTMAIVLPPLRERQEDILPLAQFILQQLSHKYGNTNLVFDTQNTAALLQHPWLGNIREMENKLERAVILADSDVVSVADLELGIAETITFDETPLSELEKISIEKSLAKNEGNISKTASALGLSRAALYRRMEKYGV
jgi:DNA-binding NtrC family response regulator